MTVNLFPLRLAKAESFCNRVKERNELKNFIKAGHHIWLQALRRHGKSSLLLKVQEDFKQDNAAIVLHRVDLAFKSDADEIIIALCKGALNLLTEMIEMSEHVNNENRFQKISNYILKTFSSFAPSMQIERGMPSITFTAKPSLDMLEKTLLTIDNEAKKRACRAVFVIDEFQQVGKTTSKNKQQKNTSIEGTIRHCLELADNINYIFCGSENTLMEQAMEDKSRPLYNHTMKVSLGRISEECYKKHIGDLWEAEWGTPFGDEVFYAIQICTQLHPYYVNALCARLWLLDDTPTIDDTIENWEEIVSQDSSDFKAIALKLTPNELKLLKALAVEPTSAPTSTEFSQYHSIPIGSIPSTLEQLIKKDLVYETNDKFMVVNPVLAYMARSA
ncbi:AAA family ATPase [Alteromonas macleodii]|uniref:AAA family ATPase n=1 Tax=Alteromonas macleodii TaxID=28108 RepID=UPI003140136B|tara:strand:- start:24370 stop:25536 length:1167 start_codon:yes stop_codon:yes gene_type:complete